MSNAKAFELVDRAINFEETNPLHQQPGPSQIGATAVKRASVVAVAKGAAKDDNLNSFRIPSRLVSFSQLNWPQNYF